MGAENKGKEFRAALIAALLAASFLFCASLAAQDSTKPKAAASSSAKPRLTAREWLDANKGAADFADRLAAFARDDADADDALDLISDYYPSIASAEGKKACAALAGRYAELLSRYRSASAWYEKAAAALPGAVDPDLSLRAAYCLMALGEFESAAPLVAEASGSTSSYAPDSSLSAAIGVRAKARMAGFWLALLGGKGQGLERQILDFIAEGENAASRAEGLLILSMREWEGGPRSAESPYAKKLLSEFGTSPEAAILRSALGKSSPADLRLEESPLWLLSGFLVRSPDAAFPGLQKAASPAALAAPSPSAPPSPSPARSPATDLKAAAQKASGFQIGSFAQRKNADALVAELRAKGFQATAREKKSSKGQTLYAVAVPAGADPGATDSKLKDAGYESVPLFD